MIVETIDQTDEQKIRDLLVGRRIVSVEEGDYDVPENRWGRAQAQLLLDDGTTILVAPNEGCGGCSNGYYEIRNVATVDNAITDVRLAVEGERNEYGEGPTSYRIYVMADAVEINAVQVDGDDGNGYYGTGYELYVIPPNSDTKVDAG